MDISYVKEEYRNNLATSTRSNSLEEEFHALYESAPRLLINPDPVPVLVDVQLHSGGKIKELRGLSVGELIYMST